MSVSIGLRLPFEHNHRLGLPSCPKCGEGASLSEGTEFSSAGSVRNDWICDRCGNHFETAAKIAAAS